MKIVEWSKMSDFHKNKNKAKWFAKQLASESLKSQKLLSKLAKYSDRKTTIPPKDRHNMCDHSSRADLSPQQESNRCLLLTGFFAEASKNRASNKLI